jgi:hypothetical protein
LERKYLFTSIGIAILIVIIISGSYGYQNYKTSQIQSLIKESVQHDNTALNYSNQATIFANKKEYTNAITADQNAIIEWNKAVELDNNALNYADGVYKEYIANDLMRISKDIGLTNDYIKALDYTKRGITYNSWDLVAEENTYSADARNYRNEMDKIRTANPDMFSFLNS